jgi:ankyrin repeat protein
MLAAMNGHTSTVKLLLDMGSDINAQVKKAVGIIILIP